MSKSRRKAGGCTSGRFKLKNMGKGWLIQRKPRGRPLPVDRSAQDAATAERAEQKASAAADAAANSES